MKKLIALTLSLCLALCATTALAQDDYAGLPDVNITCVTIFAPDTGIVLGLKQMAQALSDRTGGKLTMTIFDNGQTGGEKEQAEVLIIGEADMAAFGTLPISIYAPEYSFFDSPFVFADGGHFMAAWDSQLGDGMREKLSSVGMHTLGAMGRGYRHITSNVAINSIDDFRQVVIRTPESALFTGTFSAIGATCVPIALTELFTSLQTGVVNASEGPWDQIVSNKLYEVQDYIVESTYYYSISMWCMNQDFYNGLPEAYRALIDEVGAQALDYGSQVSAQMAEEQKQICIDAGCTILEMGDLTPYLEAVSGVMDGFFQERWPVTSAEEIASYRNQ